MGAMAKLYGGSLRFQGARGVLEGKARRPRADAERNHGRLLAAAKAVFSEMGAGASLEAVARAAGVGIGTLYRHFPTRDALWEAVYRREVEQLVELAGQLASCPDPFDAMRRWLRATVAFVATKKGMGAALAVAYGGTELRAYATDRLMGAVGSLMARGMAAGALRPDARPADLLQVLFALCHNSDAPGWQDDVLRLMDVFLDGLRLRR